MDEWNANEHPWRILIDMVTVKSGKEILQDNEGFHETEVNDLTGLYQV